MNKYEKVFESERIYYTKITKELIDDYLNMINDKEVANKISHNPKSFTYEDELKWVEINLKENAIIFSMIEKATDDYIGNIEIMHINDKGIGEIGICITAKKQNQHYGTEAMKAIIKYGIEKIGLSGLELNVYKTNPRAICCYEKVGFLQDGIGKTQEDIHMIYKKQKQYKKRGDKNDKR